jgi:hypothetical protein
MDRRIKSVKKDRRGSIVGFANRGASWSPRRAADVIEDILTNRRSYYVEQADRRAYLRVVAGTKLESTNDATSPNHLDNIPSSTKGSPPSHEDSSSD